MPSISSAIIPIMTGSTPCFAQKVLEVKLRSPYGYVADLGFTHQLARISVLADIISIHTSPLWGGSLEDVSAAAKWTSKPILAKGFHSTQSEVIAAFSAGASYVLTVGWWNGDPRCWHECESLYELSRSKAKVAVWNARCPRTGRVRTETIQDARKVRSGELCQASLIKRPEDIGPVEYVLIGEGLWEK